MLPLLAEEMMDMSVDELLDAGVHPSFIWTNEQGEVMVLDRPALEEHLYALDLLDEFEFELTDEQLDLFYRTIEGNA